ncbi:MAG: DUF2156 domain-containing protein [Nitrospira sp.]|nr:DUF2156 domain-containing protein [bacterium]MBL7047902.1 DUF2156 domain-containing protein [Nitrospira sp.]
MLPDFPTITDISIDLKGDIDRCIASEPLEASEYTFTNLFAFRMAYDFKVSALNGNLVVFHGSEAVSAFCPFGGTAMEETLSSVFEYMGRYTESPSLERVPEKFVETHLMQSGLYEVREQVGHFDYVYNVSDLIALKGHHYHDKKNKVNKFRNSYSYEYLSLTPDLIGECMEFEDAWCETRECDKFPSLGSEKRAIQELLKNFSTLDLLGGVIRVDNKLSALTIGERIGDQLIIHIEKADAEIPGLYQVINQEFLMNAAADCRFVNREQDLGLEGLRHSKSSYHPVKFIKKYRVTLKK